MMFPLHSTSTFQVRSGQLCFGALHNIHNGSSTPLQPAGFPSFPAHPQHRGTIKSQPLQFNIPAKSGTWNIYPLVRASSTTPEDIAGYFLSHETVDARTEVDKILRIAPSPYEYDEEEEPPQSRWNDENSRAAGVFLINRYDWGWSDNRSYADFYGEGYDPDASIAHEDFGSAVGLVDYSHAHEVLLRWKAMSGDRERSERSEQNGVYLWLKNHEYEFGRFGFDEERKSAQSFLFFSTYTDFTRTAFLPSDDQNKEEPLRKPETGKEIFNRRLAEGWDFSGLKKLRRMFFDPDDGTMKRMYVPPTDDQLLGPYPRQQYILVQKDIDSLRQYRPDPRPISLPRAKGSNQSAHFYYTPPKLEILNVAEGWGESILELINELAVSWLRRDVLPIIGGITTNTRSLADLLFPHHEQARSLDGKCQVYFCAPDTDPIESFDARAVGERVLLFFQARGVASDDPTVVAGLVRVMALLVTELLELATRGSIDAYQTGLTPDIVRLCVLHDDDLKRRFEYSAVFWKGFEQE